MQRTPKLGEDVHYHDHDGRTYAAKVTRVWGAYCANLTVFDDGSGRLGGHTVQMMSVSWATTYGFKGAWSYADDEPSSKPAAPPVPPAPKPAPQAAASAPAATTESEPAKS